MEGLHQKVFILEEQAKEFVLDQLMLLYMTQKALVFSKAKDGEILTAREKDLAEAENIMRKLAVVEETLDIMESIDSHQVEDYCGPTGKHVFMAQMEQHAIETRASLSKFKEQLRDFRINEQGEMDYYAAKGKLHDELRALLQVVLSKLSQLYDQKMEELNQFDLAQNQLYDPNMKELTQFDQEHTEEINDNLSAEDVLEELINLTREMGSLAVDTGKNVYDDLHVHLELLNINIDRVRDAIAIRKRKQNEIGKDDEKVFSIEEASKSDDKVPEDVSPIKEKLPAVDEDMLATIKNMSRKLKVMVAKMKARHEFQAHIAFGEKMKVVTELSAISDEEVPEMVVRRIKKWELEVVNKDTIIGLKKIGVDDQELWNVTEDKVATLKEAMSYLVMMLRVGSDTDFISHAT